MKSGFNWDLASMDGVELSKFLFTAGLMWVKGIA